jgi:hypothetical protein
MGQRCVHSSRAPWSIVEATGAFAWGKPQDTFSRAAEGGVYRSYAAGLHQLADETGLQRAPLGEAILWTTLQAAAADLLLARLAAVFFGAAFMTALRPRPREFAKSDRCASPAPDGFR